MNLTDDNNSEVKWKLLWKLKIHERFKVFIWRCANSRLPWFSQEGLCPLCDSSSDIEEHIFNECFYYHIAWRTCFGACDILIL